MIVDVEGERVTIWKTILSLLRGVGANHFEGAELLSGLVDGWGLVERVWKSKYCIEYMTIE